jgi:type I restriction enzyme S subunit
VNQGIIRDVSAYITENALSNSSAKWIKSGSLVVALAGQGKTKGMVAQLGIDATCNQSMAAVVPSSKLQSRFLFWWLSSNYQNIRNMAGGDLRDGLNLELLRDIQCPLPTDYEQTQIAKFLDYETVKIDALIAKQQQLIALLQEKRQAVISQAVTKGLNPAAPLRDSGVAWLGQVPAHWEVGKLKFFATMKGGFAFSSEHYLDDGIQILKIGNLYQNRLELDRSPTYVPPHLLNALSEFKVGQGDVLMSLTGTLGKRDYGFAVRVENSGPFLLNQRVANVSPLPGKMSARYLVSVLWSESYLAQLYSLPSGTKQANLSNADVLNIPVAVPPSIEEQEKVASALEEKTAQIDQIINRASDVIERLQERRTALISAAVTGKIDVRGWQPPPAAAAGGFDEPHGAKAKAAVLSNDAG